MTSSIRRLAEVGFAERSEVGGKCASLGEMLRAGIRVPDGFAITASAYRRFIEANGLRPRLEAALADLDAAALDQVEAASRRVRAMMEAAAVPDEIAAEVAAAYRALSGSSQEVPVAVRSSALAEDAETASFAGQQETYLWIQGTGSLLQHMVRCWASLYTPQAIAYGARLVTARAELAMAVCVQRMVDARVAGVIFTISPRTGDPSVIAINAAWGLGLGVVGGEVNPDEYWIDKVTLEIRSRRVSCKAIRYMCDPARGVISADVPIELQEKLCLTDEEAIELSRIGKLLEGRYGCPQDVEWAIGQEGEQPESVYILQSRPETVWSRRPPKPLVERMPDARDYVMRTLKGR